MDWRTTWARDAQTGKRWTTHHRHSPIGDHDAGPGPHLLALGRVDRPVEAPRSITLDGPDGGPVLSSALALSLLTGIPFRLVDTRASRATSGLRPRELKAVEAAAKLGNAEVLGASLGSVDLTFRPGPYSPADLALDLGIDGSTALVLQTLHLPIALRAESPVRLSLWGDSTALDARSVPFLETTWRAHRAALGAPVALRRDGGRLDAWIEPACLRSLPPEWLERDAIDPDSADQLLIPLALAPDRGAFRVSEVTERLRANAWTVQAFLPRRSIRIVADKGDRSAQVIVEDRNT